MKEKTNTGIWQKIHTWKIKEQILQEAEYDKKVTHCNIFIPVSFFCYIPVCDFSAIFQAIYFHSYIFQLCNFCHFPGCLFFPFSLDKVIAGKQQKTHTWKMTERKKLNSENDRKITHQKMAETEYDRKVTHCKMLEIAHPENGRIKI